MSCTLEAFTREKSIKINSSMQREQHTLQYVLQYGLIYELFKATHIIVPTNNLQSHGEMIYRT